MESSYNMLVGKRSEGQWPWKMIWKVEVPPIIARFGWIATQKLV